MSARFGATNRHNRRTFKRLPIIVAALVLLIAIAAGGWAWATSPVGGGGEPVVIIVEPGSSVSGVADELAAQGLLRSTIPFVALARLNGSAGKIQAGEYQISKTMSAGAILARLVHGDVMSYPFTIPEGYTIRQIGDLLAQKGYIDRARWDKLVYDNSDVFNYSFLPAKASSPGKGAPKGFRISRLEGFLFPDTYAYVRGMSEEQIIRMLLDRFQAAWTPELQAQAQARNMTPAQAVTLASIVEREAQAEAERPIIAGVFANRLRIGMALQSCATVNFLLERPRDILLLKDLEVDSPYNTYKHPGLPPGPIANPGEASLKAALAPAQTDYLYFVSKFDGTHAFAKTLAEHERNVRLYEGNR